MARPNGSFQLNGSIETGAAAPLDARTVVKTKSDLTDPSSYPYKYLGMIVSVQDEGVAYILTDPDTTNESSWTEIGSGDSYTMTFDAESNKLRLTPKKGNVQEVSIPVPKDAVPYRLGYDPDTDELILYENGSEKSRLKITPTGA